MFGWHEIWVHWSFGGFAGINIIVVLVFRKIAQRMA